MNPRLATLLLEWEDRRDRGEAVTAADLCADAPELAPELARRIEHLTACDRLLDDPEAPPATPAVVGRYEVRGVFGAGLSGPVYDAWDPAECRRVAVKRVRHGAWDVALDHPNVVTVYEYGADITGRRFVVSEPVTGGTLAEAAPKLRAAGAARVADVVLKTAAALAFAHSRGVAHGNLTPGKVLFTAAGEPKVNGFGRAVPAGSPAGASLTPDPATDVAALGSLLYELVVGEPPPSGAIRPAPEGPVPPVSGLTARHRRLYKLALHCLDPDPSRRPTAAAVAAAAARRPWWERVWHVG